MTYLDICHIHESSHAVIAWALSQQGGAVRCGDGRNPYRVDEDGQEYFGSATIPAQVGGWRERCVATIAGAVGTATIAGVDMPYRDYEATRDLALTHRCRNKARRQERQERPPQEPQELLGELPTLPDIPVDTLAATIEGGGAGDVVLILREIEDHVHHADHLERLNTWRETYYELRAQAINLCERHRDLIRALADHLATNGGSMDGGNIRNFLTVESYRPSIIRMVEQGRITTADAEAIIEGLLLHTSAG